MREKKNLDWSTLFDNRVISVITTYQIQPEVSDCRTWYPESFRQQCPDEKKFDMTKKYIELKRIGYNEIEIGRRLYKLPYVKNYNTPK